MEERVVLVCGAMKKLRTIVICVLLSSFGTLGCDTTESFSEEEEVVTFAEVQGLLISRGCAEGACHSGSDPSGGLDLASDSAYDALVNQPCVMPGAVDMGLNLVTPGEPDESFLYVKMSMQHADETFGLPMPMYGDGLSTEELELVRRWIDGGALR